MFTYELGRNNALKKKNWFIEIGLLIYFVLSITDRFVVEISDYIYIPIAIVEVVLIVIGIVQNRREK